MPAEIGVVSPVEHDATVGVIDRVVCRAMRDGARVEAASGHSVPHDPGPFRQ
jgi:hypothetical protein